MSGGGAALGVVLLAAGQSRRMGRLKAFLAWEGEPLVVYQVRTLQAAGVPPIVVVTGFHAGRIERCLAARVGSAARCVRNPAPAAGRAGSVRVGVAALPDSLAGYLIVGVDQPIAPAALSTLVERWGAGQPPHGGGRGGLAWVPAFEGRWGHPVLCDARLRAELLAADDAEEGLRGILRRHAADVVVVETGDPKVRCNLNTPRDYGRWAPTSE